VVSNRKLNQIGASRKAKVKYPVLFEILNYHENQKSKYKKT